ncbi:MAG TPA: hypothetical protein VGQ68_07405 [Gaiellaceae bacterium]|jgi:hypothetical protein|nr:hypothetical protein [Gaiellaceae bacterium]
MTRSASLLALLAAALLAGGCSGDDADKPAAAAAPTARSCPATWRAGWQRLANRIQAEVYCPTWMPNPLDAKFGGQWWNGLSVKPDRSYLVSFLSHDQSGDVHVNFRGYPGRTTIPSCISVKTVAGVTRRKPIPCFADQSGHRHVPGIDADVYTVNQDVDQWHVLYLWRRDGSLYTLSEHIIRPYTYRQIVHNLDLMLRGLVRVQPRRG